MNAWRPCTKWSVAPGPSPSNIRRDGDFGGLGGGGVGMGLLDKPTFPVTLTLSAELDRSKLHSTAHPVTQNILMTRGKWSTVEDKLPAVTLKCWTQVIKVSKYPQCTLSTPYIQPLSLAHRKVCEQKFPAVTYSDLPPQMAVNKQPRHIGGSLHYY